MLVTWNHLYPSTLSAWEPGILINESGYVAISLDSDDFIVEWLRTILFRYLLRKNLYVLGPPS